MAELNRLLKECSVGKRLMANPLEVAITNLGDKINTDMPEFSPVISADEEVTLEEAELFRAIADTLGCPVPPLLPGQDLAA